MAINVSDFVSPEALSQAAEPGPLQDPGQLPTGGLNVADFVNLPAPPSLDKNLFEDFGSGLAQGHEGLVAGFKGVAFLLGRELGLEGIEQFGLKGFEAAQLKGSQNQASVSSLAEIEDKGDFFQWAAQGLGQALPSLALMMTGGGIGGAVARKSIETGIKRTLAQQMRKQLLGKGFSKAAADDAVTRAFQSQFAKKMLMDGITKGTPNAELMSVAFRKGAAHAVLPSSALPQIGHVDIELHEAGIDAGLTSILAGTAAGALDAIPALRLMKKMFPGVAPSVAKSYVRDIAVAAGKQKLIEGSTEGAQEMIAIAALAYHDPSFDPTSPESMMRVADAAAVGALVGLVTGAGAQAFGGRARTPSTPRPRKKGEAKRLIPSFKFEEEKPAALPEGFNPADNTFFDEVRGRVNAAVGSVLDPIFNSTRDQAQDALDGLDTGFKGQLNKVGSKISGLVDKIQGRFIEAHRDQIDTIRQFASDTAQSIYESASTLTDPNAREAFVERGLFNLREKVHALTEPLKKKAQLSGQSFQQSVDSFEDLGELIDKQQQKELQEEEEAFEPREGHEVPVRYTFGKDNTGGINTENKLFDAVDPDAAVGWQTKELALRQLNKLRAQFPSVSKSAWALKQLADGKWVAEVATSEGNKLLTQDAQLNSAIEEARVIARGKEKPGRPRGKIESVRTPGKQTTVDLRRLANVGRTLNEQAVTLRQGLITALGRIFERGGMTRGQFLRAVRTYDKAFPREKADATKFNIGKRGEDADVRLRDDIREPRDRKNIARNRELEGNLVGPEDAPEGDARIQVKLPFRDPKLGPVTAEEVLGRREGKQLVDTDSAADDTSLAGKTPSEAQEARRAAREASVPKADTEVSQSKDRGNIRTETKDKPQVEIITSGISTELELGAELVALVKRFTNLLTNKKTRVTIVETKDMNVVENHPNSSERLRDMTGTIDFMIMEAISPASVIYDAETNDVFIFINDLSRNKAQTVGFLMHELGHVVHFDTWAHLNKAEQDSLWNAFKADVEAGRTTGGALQGQAAIEGFENLVDPDTPSALSIFEFREWMADQFVLWTTGRSKPRGVLKTFLEELGAKLKQLYDYIQQNPGRMGKLNETYAQFADAVARKAVGLNPPGVNYFVREGPAGRGLKTIMTQMVADLPITDLTDIDAAMAELAALEEADADIIASGVVAIPVNQRAQLQKRIAKYPQLVKNVQVFNKWVKNAWDLILSPATHTMRQIGIRVPVANEIANIFGRNIGKPKDSQNYHDRTSQMNGSWSEKFFIITKGMTPAQKESLARRLQALDGTSNKPETLREQQMRKFFDDMLVYIRESGLPVAKVKNYFPRAFNYELLTLDENEIVAHLQKNHGMSLDNARSFYQSMSSPEMRADQALGETAPAFKAMRSRTLTDSFFDKYQSDTLDGIVTNYINSAVKRAEYNRFLGEKAPRGATRADDLKKSTWDPKGKLNRFMLKAKDQGATADDLKTMGMYIDAQLGMLGRDNKIAKKGRTAMAAMVAYQNMRVLLFTVFASFPDLMGPSIRAGSMTDAFKSLSGKMWMLMQTDTDLADMARAYGIISREASNHIMTEYVDNHFMPPTLRRMNEAYFKWTGLNWYTDFTRKMALAVGVDYVKNMARRSADPSIRSRERIKAQAALKELGLTKQAVEAWVADGEQVWGSQAYTKTGKAARADQAVSESLVQFVNESIMRPNASQRPILASHPNAMLVFHLKGYMFSMYEVVVKRMMHNFNLSSTDYQSAAALMPAVAILGLTAVGLELRELLQYAFTGRTPPTDRMGGLEYVGTLVDRSGLLGQSQMAFDGASGDLMFLGGPAIEQIGSAVMNPSRFKLSRATPVLSQMPSLRQFL